MKDVILEYYDLHENIKIITICKRLTMKISVILNVTLNRDIDGYFM